MSWDKWIAQVDSILKEWGFPRKRYTTFKSTQYLSELYQRGTCPGNAAFLLALDLTA